VDAAVSKHQSARLEHTSGKRLPDHLTLFASLTGLRQPNFSHSKKSRGFHADDRYITIMKHSKLTPPKHLNALQKKKWLEIIEKLQQVGSYEKTDLDLVELYVCSWTVYLDAMRLLKTEPRILVSPRTGSPYRNPLIDDQSNAFNQLLHLSTLLGLNPIGRKRLKLTDKKEIDPDDDFSEFGI